MVRAAGRLISPAASAARTAGTRWARSTAVPTRAAAVRAATRSMNPTSAVADTSSSVVEPTYPAISRAWWACAQAITRSQPPIRSNRSKSLPPDWSPSMSASNPSGTYCDHLVSSNTGATWGESRKSCSNIRSIVPDRPTVPPMILPRRVRAAALRACGAGRLAIEWSGSAQASSGPG